MDWHQIQTKKDVTYFLEKTNALHDGYLLSVQYENKGIMSHEYGYDFDFSLTKLTIRILITSIRDAIAEIEFSNIAEWQIQEFWQSAILDTSIVFRKRGIYDFIVWADGDSMEDGSYVVAQFMKWRLITEE